LNGITQKFEMGRILFLCTGNYYRSRFAEELFNHRARQARLSWSADSRALAIERGRGNVGPISAHAVAGLTQLGVDPSGRGRTPRQCLVEDLSNAQLIVALEQAEHRPLLLERFPDWEARVRYWHVRDIEFEAPTKALAGLVTKVDELVAELTSRVAPL
jgi:protein-tyrosine phosphatase